MEEQSNTESNATGSDPVPSNANRIFDKPKWGPGNTPHQVTGEQESAEMEISSVYSEYASQNAQVEVRMIRVLNRSLVYDNVMY